MTTITVWLLVAVGFSTSQYSAVQHAVIERFADFAECSRVAAILKRRQGDFECIQAKVVAR